MRLPGVSLLLLLLLALVASFDSASSLQQQRNVTDVPSLIAAAAWASALSPGDTALINVGPGDYILNATVSFIEGAGEITLQHGDGGAATLVCGGNASSFTAVQFYGVPAVSVRGLAFTGCLSTAMTVDFHASAGGKSSSSFSNVSAAVTASATFSDCSFSSNTGGAQAGALSVRSAAGVNVTRVAIRACTFVSNGADPFGGGALGTPHPNETAHAALVSASEGSLSVSRWRFFSYGCVNIRRVCRRYTSPTSYPGYGGRRLLLWRKRRPRAFGGLGSGGGWGVAIFCGGPVIILVPTSYAFSLMHI